MTESSRTRTKKVQCQALTVVSAVELVGVAAVTDLVQSHDGCLRCELAAHDGSHVALVGTTQGGDRWWWLRWDDRVSEVVEADPCQAQLPQGPYADDCFLPEGHPGRHSFDVSPPPPPVRRHVVRPLSPRPRRP
ncbi:MAG TPA: hypothetical protein VFH03_23750 [Actinoplanes sp.]|nr:hypothetical protein [Actinoplanes sp.]